MTDDVWLFVIFYGEYYRLWTTIDAPSYNNAVNSLMREADIVDEFIYYLATTKLYFMHYDEAKKLVIELFPKIMRAHGHFIHISPELRDKFDKEEIHDEDFINIGINPQNPHDKGEDPFLFPSVSWFDYIKNTA